jgi:hypothetical protein
MPLDGGKPLPLPPPESVLMGISVPGRHRFTEVMCRDGMLAVSKLVAGYDYKPDLGTTVVIFDVRPRDVAEFQCRLWRILQHGESLFHQDAHVWRTKEVITFREGPDG